MDNINSAFIEIANAVPDVILEIRYYSTFNFVGERIDGYVEPTALLTKEAAKALKIASVINRVLLEIHGG
jgi:D-alanyl-D-alanine dipeptidase